MSNLRCVVVAAAATVLLFPLATGETVPAEAQTRNDQSAKATSHSEEELSVGRFEMITEDGLWRLDTATGNTGSF